VIEGDWVDEDSRGRGIDKCLRRFLKAVAGGGARVWWAGKLIKR